MNGKEQVKTLLLVFLVISNLVLGCRIWIQKKLWPDGYNFFYSIKNSSIIRMIADKGASLYAQSHIALPDRIIINTGYQTTRFLLNSTHERFKFANDTAYEVLTEAFSADARYISEISEEEWYSALTSRSVYLSYDINYSSDIMPQFFENRRTDLEQFTDIISDVVISDADTGGISVIFKNGRENKYYRVQLQNFSKENIDKLISYFQNKFDENDTKSSMIINYSFELLFDKANESQRVIIAPMIPIFNTPVTYEKIKSENPITRTDGTPDSQTIKELLDIFDINSNSMRRHTERNGTVVFVENDTILKLSPDGYLTYTSNRNSGILNSGGSLYTAVCMVSEFMDRINYISGSNADLYISSDLTDMNYDKARITFDYIVGGIPVTIENPEFSHAVEVTVENGYITEYRQVLRSYEMTSAVMQTPMYIQAIDSVSDNGGSDKYTSVEKMYVSYFDDLSIGEKEADWRLIVNELEQS